jgi:hypothetical protein
MRNKLSLLGFLGLLGLLGLVTHNPGFYGFCGFLGFFGFARMLPDEFFRVNADKAARNAFVSSVVIYPITLTWGVVTSSAMVLAVGFVISFAVQMLVFVLSFAAYERGGGR